MSAASHPQPERGTQDDRSQRQPLLPLRRRCSALLLSGALAAQTADAPQPRKDHAERDLDHDAAAASASEPGRAIGRAAQLPAPFGRAPHGERLVEAALPDANRLVERP